MLAVHMTSVSGLAFQFSTSMNSPTAPSLWEPFSPDKVTGGSLHFSCTMNYPSSEPSGFEGSELVKRAAKEKWLMYSLEGGLQTLVETLVEAVEEMGGELLLNSGVTSVEFDGGRPKVSCTHADP